RSTVLPSYREVLRAVNRDGLAAIEPAGSHSDESVFGARLRELAALDFRLAGRTREHARFPAERRLLTSLRTAPSWRPAGTSGGCGSWRGWRLRWRRSGQSRSHGSFCRSLW